MALHDPAPTLQLAPTALRLRAPGLTRLLGVGIALLVIGGWVVCLALSLSGVVSSWAGQGALVVVNTLLSTGLFITAHDAMHGVVLPGSARVNRAVGQVALGVYAAFAFQPLFEAQHRHNRRPARADDPDYHDGERPGFVRWYLRFMRRYLTLGQVVRLAVVFNVLVHVLGVPEARVLLLWVLPLLLSTTQLFYFGTYRTHREPAGGYPDAHRSTSNDFPVWLSFLTCFHFGYHHEHHANPQAPWWRLPAERAKRQQGLR